ncbi:radical SAM/SPASM domain-containing protein [Desulfocucumis palustris]|nr:radical SAM protein [Desulfocucumis palustris]
MKPSFYNFIWPTEDPGKVMIFNSLTTSLAEVGRTHAKLLNTPRFEYNDLPEAAKQFAGGLKQGGFLLEDETDELKILKFAYNSGKYDPRRLGLTIAPTLRCNFACTYCFEQAGKDQDRRDGRHAFMTEQVQQGLLNYIKRAAKTIKGLHIAWFGGEPLLGKEIIFDLSEKILAVAGENNLDYTAHMVTNGYLLAGDPEIVRKLKDSRITGFQITVDGPPEAHNSRRMLKAGGPTFDRILEGIKLLKANEMKVGLRVNVDRSNMDDALKLLNILEDNNLKDIAIHLGHVSPYSSGCKSIENSCATKEEFTVLNQTLQRELRLRGFKAGQTPYYPRVADSCTANQTNTFVLDPDGDMYKCWSEVGDKSARIGNIIDYKGRGKAERMHEIRWLTWEPFETAECLECKILPICMGSCAYKAMFVNSGKPDCAEWKYSLEHYVRDRYNREKEIKNSIPV